MKIVVKLLILLSIQNIMVGQSENTNFGIQFNDTIVLPSSNSYITDLKLYELSNKDSKKYYNCLTVPDKRKLICGQPKFISKKDSLHEILIPPLKPNKFYTLKVTYTGDYNLYGLFRNLHKEGLPTTGEKAKWMEITRFISNIPSITTPILKVQQFHELESLKKKVKDIDLSDLTKVDTSAIISIVTNSIPNLKFKQDKISEQQYFDYLIWLKSKQSFNAIDLSEIQIYFGKVYDYIGIYEFYSNRLKPYFENVSFDNPTKLVEFIKTQITLEKQRLIDLYISDYPNYILPNYLADEYFDQIISYTTTQYTTTYAKSFESSYKRTIVPDFGYTAFLPTENGLKGGNFFIGLNISLMPVNKETPLSLSQLNVLQRLSFHTGITLSSLSEENKRQNFFTDRSLILGVGLKVFNQSSRVILGTTIFKKNNPINSQTSIAMQPHIGLSIDLEIKKWIESIISKPSNIQ